jgi:hypothetical protein
MRGSPRKKRGESPQTGAKPGATLRLWSERAAEGPFRRMNHEAPFALAQGKQDKLKPGRYIGTRSRVSLVFSVCLIRCF